MARIGFKYFCGAKMKTEPMDAEPTYEAGKQLGKAVSSNLSITNSEGELWADDQIAESMSEFASGTFTAEVDNIALADQAYMYGAKYVDGELENSVVTDVTTTVEPTDHVVKTYGAGAPVSPLTGPDGTTNAPASYSKVLTGKATGY